MTDHDDIQLPGDEPMPEEYTGADLPPTEAEQALAEAAVAAWDALDGEG